MNEKLYSDYTLNALADLQRRRSKESFPQCEQWTLPDLMTAIMGELGEAANELKKLRRGDLCKYPGERHDKVALELIDTLTYTLLMLNMMDYDIEHIFARKFNEVSERVSSPLRLGLRVAKSGEASNSTQTEE